MKKGFLLITCLLLLLVSCKKDTLDTVETPIVVTPDIKELSKGTFASNAHTTSGTVKLTEDKDKNKFLVFENFKTDAGPDLRIYLAEDLNAAKYTEITKDVKAGTYQLSVPATANTTTQKYVLIWCKQFSVLFGNAELK